MLTTKKQLMSFLSERITSERANIKNLPNPSLLKNLDVAAERIVRAIKNGESIGLIGDYDVDGVISTTIMVSFFTEIGTKLFWRIPNRFTHGYGISPKILNEMPELDVVFTVDNGIAAFEAAQWCKDRNTDFIITDHHEPREAGNIPDAYTIVDQKIKPNTFPFDEICGAQIAWYLIREISNQLGYDLESGAYLEFVGIAIVADIMPLIDMNRAMLKYSLRRMNTSKFPFFNEVKKHIYGNSFNSESIGFGIAPMINAVGRLGNAEEAVMTLLANNNQDAEIGILKFIEENEKRKEIERIVSEQAIDSNISKSDKLVIAIGNDWHEGVVGIVASRLVDKFKVPAIVLSKNGDFYKGSGRSLGNVNLFDLLTHCASFDLFNKYGGHKLAGGLSLHSDNLNKFIDVASEYADSIPNEDFFDSSKNSIASLPLSELNLELVKELETFEPFGFRNEKPILSMENVVVESIKILKEVHTKLVVMAHSNGIRNRVEMIWFNGVDVNLTPGTLITVNFQLGTSFFRGEESMSAIINDITFL